MWSTVRKAVGSARTGYLGDWQAGREYVGGVGPLARKLWVWFEPDMAPGYAWSFPLADGTANVGYGVVRRPGVGSRTTPGAARSISSLARTSPPCSDPTPRPSARGRAGPFRPASAPPP